MNTISHITLPSGSTYELKDAYARQLLAGGIQFAVCWDGASEPVIANIPAGVKVVYQSVEYTGTKAASTAEPLTFYLVKSSTQAGYNDIYDEYVAIKKGAGTELDPYVYSWEKLGDTNIDLSNLGALAYKDNVTLNKGTAVSVLGADATFKAESSTVTFASGAGSDFVTGYNNDGVAPSFTEGAFSAGSLPSFTEGAFSAGSLPSFSEGAFTPAAIQTGFVTAGTAPSFTEGSFSAGSLPSLGAATVEAKGLEASMGTGADAETLILTAVNVVTAQGTFDAGSLPSKAADSFSAGTTPSVIDVTKFSGGSKAADTWSAGSLPSKAADTWDAGSLPSKAADSFDAGSAATLAKSKALTASDTGTAAAQSVSSDSKDSKSVALYDSLSVSVS